MWELHAYGRFGTPDRRYAVLDEKGEVRWAGETMQAAMIFAWDRAMAGQMETDHAGAGVVHEHPSHPGDDPPS